MSEPGAVVWRALWVETAERLGDPNEARWLCEAASGFEGADWLGALDVAATQRSVARLDAMVQRRMAGEPVQYVLGSWPFRRLDLYVDRRVLIPRPETEQVVGVALELAAGLAPPLTVVDLGTGSGAIALSLALELPLGAAEVWATDRSADALDVARANLAGIGRAGAHVRLAEGDWYGALPAELRGRVDLVISNPPYIGSDDEVAREVTDWEPDGALMAGPDGLDALRQIVDGATEWLRPGGWLVCEIGAGQGRSVAELAGAAGLVDVAVRRDLSGRERALVARRPV